VLFSRLGRDVVQQALALPGVKLWAAAVTHSPKTVRVVRSLTVALLSLIAFAPSVRTHGTRASRPRFCGGTTLLAEYWRCCC
jgi:hypothetical protein